ncbi:restriction endonuclease subunit S [Limosilactobacillus reuteri]|uniref:restriction endonuclease subunit S n=1 Tax=Limosilactobacillus reuteri TaxID=1598 RepID=UPI000A2E50BC|nr:restriction endonuclease subunit S [Limosilactobacillus reuteri]OTA71144.1 hypothetical protein BHL76_08115 [Limosilactobacillus reuteri]OTA78070.1 hypothetical protein BHL81_06935 [Limosilactobacillus reuteri]
MDKKPEKMVPEVRFKGFTDDWEQRKLGESLSLLKDGTHGSYESVQQGAWLLSAKNIINNRVVITSNDRKISENDFKKIHDKFQLRKGDVLLTIVGTIGRSAILKEANKLTFQRSVAYLRPDENILTSSDFLFSLSKSSNFQNQLKKRTVISAQPGIYLSDIDKLNITIPEIKKEQDKIASIIITIDNILSLQQRKLKQLERLKTAMLQQLLANQRFPKVRFNDFKDSWKDYRLGEVFDEFSVKSKRENEYKLLSSTTSGMESRSGRVSGRSNIGYKVIDNGDIVLSPQNLWLGNINLNNMGKGIVSPSYHTFKIVNANPIFVNFQLKTEKMLFEYKMVSVQGASVVRRNLDMDAFKKIVIKIPNEKEQIKIASLFSSISNIINNHQNKLTQLSTLKKYLLQKMFI